MSMEPSGQEITFPTPAVTTTSHRVKAINFTTASNSLPTIKVEVTYGGDVSRFTDGYITGIIFNKGYIQVQWSDGTSKQVNLT